MRTSFRLLPLLVLTLMPVPGIAGGRHSRPSGHSTHSQAAKSRKSPGEPKHASIRMPIYTVTAPLPNNRSQKKKALTNSKPRGDRSEHQTSSR